jgi:GAF domain-containing protein
VEESLQRVVDEQAALRRVAALVAEGAAAGELFAVAAEEIGRVLEVPSVRVARFDPDAVVVLGEFNYRGFPAGSVWPHDAPGVAKTVFETGRPARVDDHSGLSGIAAETNRALGITSAVGAPIVVAGGVWGLIVVATTDPEALPDDTEERLARFTELMAISIASTQARADLRELLDEQSALNRLAGLVAEGADSSAVFEAVCEETGRVIGASSVNLAHYTPDGINVTMAGWSLGGTHLAAGTRLPLAPDVVGYQIRQTSAPTRIDSYANATSELALLVRDAGIRSSVAAPVIVDGQVWGALIASTVGVEPLALGTERRLVHFTELVATAIANAEARDGLRRLSEEQAALRRRFTIASEQSRANLLELLDEQAALHNVARLVAEGADSSAVFDAVCAEAGRLMGASSVNLAHYTPDGFNVTMAGWSLRATHVPVGTRLPLAPDTIGYTIQKTSAPARVDSYEGATSELALLIRKAGIRSSVGAPIIVDGRVWGALVAGTDGDDPLPGGTEERLARFSELIATAIANAEARHGLHQLADEQVALRRVATLVAREASQGEIFAAIADAMSGLLAEQLRMVRFEGNDAVVVAGSDDEHNDVFPVGSRIPLGGNNSVSRVFRTGKPARIDDYQEASGPIAEAVRAKGLRSVVATPIVVSGGMWGAMTMATFGEELVPADTERRLGQCTDLMATAIANAEARAKVERLAEEQAALRRVATLVAGAAPSSEVFSAVAMEVGKLLDTDITIVGRYDDDGYATSIGNWSASPGGVPVGTRSVIGGRNVLTIVHATGQPARIDAYDEATGEAADIARSHGWRSSIAAPIAVEGRVWGVMLVATTRDEPFPAGSEERLAAFTGLVATALANATARAALIESRARIVAAGDEARRRIERNLHDGTQQRLIALGLDIAAVRESAPRDEPDLHANLERLEREVEQVLDEVRELSRGLHPGLLSRQGLGPSLRALARKSALPVTIEVDLPERPPGPVETCTYFVVSEALTNAVKHAQASYLTVSVAADDSHLRATIADDGVGGADPGAGAGSGLIGLADRVNALGGRFTLESPPGRGTTISIELPLVA